MKALRSALRFAWRAWCARYAWWRAKHSAAALRNAEVARRSASYAPRLHRSWRR